LLLIVFIILIFILILLFFRHGFATRGVRQPSAQVKITLPHSPVLMAAKPFWNSAYG
jgi:hypothetical protein